MHTYTFACFFNPVLIRSITYQIVAITLKYMMSTVTSCDEDNNFFVHTQDSSLNFAKLGGFRPTGTTPHEGKTFD